MRPVLALVLCLALATAMVAADFNVSAYLYDTETAQSVSSRTLSTSSSTVYTLYTINNIPSLLVSNGEPLTDTSAISTLLREDQTRTLMPTDAEMATLRASLLKFNDSRNVKYDPQSRYWSDGLEWTCLRNSGLGSTYPRKFSLCSDSTTCYSAAALLCMRYDTGSCLPDQISPYLLVYSKAISQLNTNMPSAINRLNSLSLDNGVEQLAGLQTDIAALKSASSTIAASKMRATVASSCPDCLGICPEASLDTASLTTASDLAKTLSTRLSSASSVTAATAQIVQSTNERIDYAKSATLAQAWTPKWTAFKTKYATLRAQVANLSSVSKDTNFSSSAAVFEQLWSTMETRVTTRKGFESADTDFARLSAQVPTLQTAVVNGLVPYQNARAAQNKAGDALIEARWRILSSDTSMVIAYNKLATRKSALDGNFTPPLTTAQYQALTTAYGVVINDSAKIYSAGASSSDPIASVSEQFSENSVSGAFALTSALVPLSSTTRNQVAPAIPAIVLLLADLAIASVMLVVFIGVLLHLRPLFRSRSMLGLWMVALLLALFILGLGSVGLYMSMNQRASSGTLASFEREIALTNRTYIAIDQAGAPSDAISAMTACAQNISGQLRTRWNKTATTFTYLGKTCVKGGQSNLTAVQCFDSVVDYPVFVLHYNATTSDPHFSTVYSKQADAYGNSAYYTRCEIGDVLN